MTYQKEEDNFTMITHKVFICKNAEIVFDVMVQHASIGCRCTCWV